MSRETNEPVVDARRHRVWASFLLLALVALLVRVPAGVLFGKTPIGRYLYMDSEQYDMLAMRIAGGDLMGTEPFFVEPAYAYVIALLYHVFGHELLPVRIFQALAGTATVLLVFDAARRLYGRWAGRLAGVAAALYGPFVFYDTMILKTSLEVLLGAFTAWMLVRSGAGSGLVFWVGLGAVVGAGTIVKGNFALLVPLAAACAFRVSARRYRSAAAVLAGAVLFILPVVVRNSVFSGGLAFVTTGAGMNFFQGNYAGTGGGLEIPDFIQPNPRFEQRDSVAEASRRAGRPLSPAQASGFWFRESLRYIAGSPLDWARLMGRKALLFWNYFEAGDNLGFYYARDVVRFLRVSFVGFFVVGPVGLAGLLFALRDRGRGAWLSAFVLVWMVSVVLFHVADRYRLAAVPALMVLGAGFGAHWVSAAARRSRNALMAGAALLGVSAAIVHVPRFYPHGQDASTFDRIMGYGYEQQGQTQKAAWYYGKAADAFFKEGRAAFQKGRAHRAELFFRDALDVRPRYPGASFFLGAALETQGKTAEALVAYEAAVFTGSQAVEALVRIGLIELRGGELEQAEMTLREAAARAPSLFEVLVATGELRAGQGRLDEARGLYERALAVRPDAGWLRDRISGLGPS